MLQKPQAPQTSSDWSTAMTPHAAKWLDHTINIDCHKSHTDHNII